MLLVLHWYSSLYVLVLWVLLVHWYHPLHVSAPMLLGLYLYCSLCVLVLWVLLVHWYQPLYVSVSICYWYHTGTTLYMYLYCGYCWYTCTRHSIFLYQYVTGTALVLLFICTGTVATVGTLVQATPHSYQPLYVNVSICYWYHTVTALYMYRYCGYCFLHWYQPLYFSVPMCYWYCNDTAYYMSWYCGYC